MYKNMRHNSTLNQTLNQANVLELILREISFIFIFKISQSMIEGWTRNGRSRSKNEKQEI